MVDEQVEMAGSQGRGSPTKRGGRFGKAISNAFLRSQVGERRNDELFAAAKEKAGRN
jgi:hypothetical protein